MKILVVNCGSSSLKYQLIDMETETLLAKGLCERIGIDGRLKHEAIGKDKFVSEEPLKDHNDAIQAVLKALLDPEHGVIKSVDEIDAVGHRVAHGGVGFAKSVLITPEVKAAIDRNSELAPLHNPANLIGIEACEKIMNVPMVAVFDTAFHQTMPEKAYLYAIPYKYYEKYKIRKYGFHGISHQYVANRVAQLKNVPAKSLKIVNCHLGQGASICAILNGKSVDTSMGFTPLGGIPMGTRSGDLDPSVVTYIMEKENIESKEMENILNNKSGVFGVSEVSVDFRDIEAEAEKGDHNAKLAMKIFIYDVAQFIAKYAVAMQGIDVITFTAGVGEKGIEDREEICKYLEFLGVKIDKELNNHKNIEAKISSKDSKIEVWVIPTNEELLIAKDTERIVKSTIS